jgi:hypothetical protein
MLALRRRSSCCRGRRGPSLPCAAGCHLAPPPRALSAALHLVIFSRARHSPLQSQSSPLRSAIAARSPPRALPAAANSPSPRALCRRQRYTAVVARRLPPQRILHRDATFPSFALSFTFQICVYYLQENAHSQHRNPSFSWPSPYGPSTAIVTITSSSFISYLQPVYGSSSLSSDCRAPIAHCHC